MADDKLKEVEEAARKAEEELLELKGGKRQVPKLAPKKVQKPVPKPAVKEPVIIEDSDCIFCKIVNGSAPSNKVYEDDNFVAFLDINHKVDNHVILIPKKHFRAIMDVPNTLGNEMLAAVKEISMNLIKEGKAEGFNFIVNNEKVAGQIVDHVHIHILPRKTGDGFSLGV